MRYEVELTGNVPEAARTGAEALREEGRAAREMAAAMASASRSLGELAAAQRAAATARPAFSASTAENFRPSRWEQPGPPPAPEKPKGPDEEKQRPSLLSRLATEAKKSGKEQADAARSVALSAQDAAKGLIAYGAAMAGLHGMRDLAQMAIGWRGMAQLQLLSWKATMDLRQAVRGVDAGPLVRATTALERNLSKSTVTGSALSGILTRGFNAAFSVIERLEPVAESFFQGLVLGGLEAEIAWHKSRAAAAPLIALIEDMTGGVDGIGIAAEGATTAFRAMANVVETIAGGISSAVTAMDTLVRKTVRWSYDTPEFRAQAEAEKAREERARAAEQPSKNREVFQIENGKAKRIDIVDQTEGIDVGRDIGRGIVKGLDAETGAVREAGRRAGASAVEGARAGADAHSPSRSTERLGRDIDAGGVKGMEADAGKVQAAAERVFTLDVQAAAPAPSSSGAAPGHPSMSIGQIGPFVFGESVPQNTRQNAEEMVREGIRAALQRLGIPLPGVA